MGCFNLIFLQQLVIWTVVIIAIVAVIRLLIPYVDDFTRKPIIGRILEIVLWLIVAVAVHPAGGEFFPAPRLCAMLQ